MRSWDSASAGERGSVLEVVESVEARLDMLMKTGDVCGAWTALRMMGLGDSTTFGRLRFRIGVGWEVVVNVWGGVGIGGTSLEVETRGECSEGA